MQLAGDAKALELEHAWIERDDESPDVWRSWARVRFAKTDGSGDRRPARGSIGSQAAMGRRRPHTSMANIAPTAILAPLVQLSDIYQWHTTS